METIKNLNRLLHFPTLLLIAVMQVVTYYFIITPMLAQYGMTPLMSVMDLANLVLASVFMAAGGFVINDYFDLKIDEINRPLTRVVGRVIEKHSAMTLYIALTVVGVLFALWLCWHARSFDYALMMLFFTGILWFYSSTYKRILVLGNLVVAILMGLVPMMVTIFQNYFLVQHFMMDPDLSLLMSDCLSYTGGIALLVFAWTFVVEVIKDLSTEKGDRELECHTFPIVWGEKKTKILLYVWITLIWAVFGYIIYNTPALHSSLSLRLYVCFTLIPAFSLYYVIAKARNAGDYRLLVNYSIVILALNVFYSYALFHN